MARNMRNKPMNAAAKRVHHHLTKAAEHHNKSAMHHEEAQKHMKGVLIPSEIKGRKKGVKK